MKEPARTLYLVCYDIADPKRLYHVHRFLLGYKVGGQKSFFECWLTHAERRDVQETLLEIIDPEKDRIHIFQLDPRQPIRCLGQGTPPQQGAFLIL